MLKKVLKILGLVLLILVVCVGGYVGFEVSQFNASMDHVYDIPLPAVVRSTDPTVLARGEHLARSFGSCALSDCHGANLAGGRTIDVGPIGEFSAPNLTLLAQAYSDGELARLIRHGVRRDGRSVRFMPAQEVNWMPQSDIDAIISWIRTVPVVSRANGPMRFTPMAKVFDRRNMFVVDVARRIDHNAQANPPAPEPTAAYGRYIAHICSGCHGAGFGGGPIPGTPPSLPVPLNITPDASGLAAWTYDDFVRLADQGLRKNGNRVNPFMPTEALAHMDETERHALWAFLQQLPPRPFGSR